MSDVAATAGWGKPGNGGVGWGDAPKLPANPEKKESEAVEGITKNLDSLKTEEEVDDDIKVSKKHSGLVQEHDENVVEVQLVDIQDDEENPLYTGVKTFEDLGLHTDLLKGLYAMGFQRPSKIQEKALPLLLANPPRNMIGQSQSGTGKTAAFALTMLSRVNPESPTTQAICLAPARELARQIMDVVRDMGKFTTITTAFAIKDSVERGAKVNANIVVGTPGTVMDLIKRRQIDARDVRIFVLDEADNMIDQQGLGDQSIRIRNMMPKTCQVVLFSATFTDQLRAFAAKFAPNANMISLRQEELSVDTIRQLYMDCKNEDHKVDVLMAIYGLLTIGQSIIFVRRRDKAEMLARVMNEQGHSVTLLHGAQDAAVRDQMIDDFRDGKSKVLITTNVLARGIDILQVNLVINYDMPLDSQNMPDPETYLHRIGRTGRFGRTGVSINFVHDQRSYEEMKAIETHFGREIKRIPTEDYMQIESMLKKAVNDDDHQVDEFGVKREKNRYREGDSFFVEALLSWRDLNCTANFSAFLKEVSPISQSLQQVLYHKDTIVDTLITFLNKSDILSLEPLLNLVTLLARDLQEEFYVHFNRVFPAVVNIVRRDNVEPEVLEWIFNTVAFLFKYLAKEVCEDVLLVFADFQFVLQDKRAYIRTFGAESFGFLVRKLKPQKAEELFIDLVKSLRDLPTKDYCEGCSLLLFETLKHVQSTLHSKAKSFFQLLIEIVINGSDDEDDIALSMLVKIMTLLGHYLKSATAMDIWDVLLEDVNSRMKTLDSDDSASAVACLDKALELMAVLVMIRKGNKISDRPTVIKLVNSLIEKILLSTNGKKSSRRTVNVILNMTASLVTYGTLQNALMVSKECLDPLFELEDTESVFTFCETLRLQKSVHYNKIIVPRVLRYITKVWDADSQGSAYVLANLLQHISETDIHEVPSEWRTENNLIRVQTSSKAGKGKNLSVIILDHLEATSSAVFEAIFNGSSLQAESIYLMANLCRTIQKLYAPVQRTSEVIINLLRKTISAFKYPSFAEAESSISKELRTLISIFLDSLHSIYQKVKDEQVFGELWSMIVTDIIPLSREHVICMKSVANLAELIVAQVPKALSVSPTDFDTLIENLGSLNSSLRLSSSRILLVYCNISKEAPAQFQEILSSINSIEQIPNAPDTSRDKTLLIKKLEMVGAGGCTEVVYDAIVRYLLALLSEKFAPVIADASTALHAVSKRNGDRFWKLYFGRLMWTKTRRAEAEEHEKAPSKPEVPKKQTYKYSFSCFSTDGITEALEQSRESVKNISQALRVQFRKVDSKERVPVMDSSQYYLGLLKILRSAIGLVEKHSADILPLFFELFGVKHLEENEMDVDEEESSKHKMTGEVSQSGRAVVIEFLYIFENLRNPTNLYKASQLYALLLNLLSNGESKIQQLALKSLLSWKEPGVIAYAEHLEGLTKDEKFRDFLSTFDLESVESGVKTQHRPALFAVIIRILYGKLINRRGRGSSKSGLKARRNAIFSFLVGLDDATRSDFFELMVSPFAEILNGPDFDSDGVFQLMNANVSATAACAPRHKLGFVNVLEDMIKQLRNYLIPELPKVVKLLLYFINGSEQDVASGSDGTHSDDEDENPVEESARQKKTLRQTCIKRLTTLFSLGMDFNYDAYIPCMFATFINARVDNFHIENTQAPSALLELFAAWSKNKNYAFYLSRHDNLMKEILITLTAKGVKESVISIILEILEAILTLDKEAEAATTVFADALIKPNIDILLEQFGLLFTSAFKDGTGLKTYNAPTRMIGILSEIAEHVPTPTIAEKVMLLLLPCLRKSDRAVSLMIKGRILDIWQKFLPHLPSLKEAENPKKTPYYVTLSSMFSSLSDRANKVRLVAIFKEFSAIDESLNRIFPIIENLNAFSSNRIDEVNFNARFDALDQIGQTLYKELTTDEWLPILHNLLNLVQDETEFSIRTSSAHCLSQFLQVASETDERPELVDQVVHVLFPAIKKGLRIHPEVVRQELIQLLGLIVKNLPSRPEFSDMVCLLADSDEEASFFTNIYHLQVHRRIRAMGRLADACRQNKIKSSNAGNIFIPMLTRTLYDSDRVADNRLVNESILTIAACSNCLAWGKYYEVLKTFLKNIPRRPIIEKELVRVVVAIVDHFHFDMTDEAPADAPTEVEIENDTKDADIPDAIESQTLGAEDTVMDEDALEDDNADDDAQAPMDVDVSKPEVNKAQAFRIYSIVINKIIPELFTHLAKKEEQNLNLRVPVAIGIASLLKKMPIRAMESQLPKLLTSLCQFLRSRLQDVRDGCREALARIAKDIGPSYFHFIVRELHGALQKGYQLHVLGYSLHHLICHVIEEFPHGFVHSSLDMIVKIIANDIFGSLSEEREVQELQGKLKEMKNTKSFDTFELISTVIDLDRVERLLLPLKEIMLETASLKTTRKIDESLHRVAQGLMRNEAIEVQEAMVFIHGLMTENLSLSHVEMHTSGQKSNLEKNYTVQLKRQDALQQKLGYFKANAFRFVEFGLSLLLGAIKKEKLSSKSPEHLQMVDPLVEPLGKAMFSKHTSIPVAAIRVLCQIAKWPLPSLEKTMVIVVKRCFEMIAKGAYAGTETAHSVFRLLAVVIRDCTYIDINQKQLIVLINLLIPDLEEPEHQATTFSLIRAILSRKYVFAEVYDLMQVIAKIAITSQSKQVRELCRQAYMQFLLEYPHGPVRLRKQVNYIVKNLKYEFESGRESMLLLLGSVVDKFTDAVLLDFAELLFLSLIVSLVNDDSSKCRELSATTIKKLLQRLDSTRRSNCVTILDGWFKKEEPSLQRMAAQVYGLLLESVDASEGKPLLNSLFNDLGKTLQGVIDELHSAQLDSAEVYISDASDLERWEAGYYTLNTLAKILKIYGTQSLLVSKNMWTHVSVLLLYPHAWIRSISTKLFGVLFGLVAEPSSGADAESVLTDLNLSDIAYRMCVQLISDHLTEEHATQIVKNLVYLGRRLLVMPAVIEEQKDGVAKVGKPPLLRVFTKLSHMAREEIGTSNKMLMRRSVFEWFGAMLSLIPKEELKPFLKPALSILYRASEDTAVRTTETDELRTTAREIMGVLEKLAGTSTYLEVYNQVHQEVQEVRQERRLKRKIQAVADPEGAAKRKIQKNQMKIAGRKEKAAQYKKKLL
ncbi:U3 snoRNP protein [Chytridiales sp. JEL 0842]|nr:U3 snoRNP protein [Chytridiales sp. JEL 0842]